MKRQLDNFCKQIIFEKLSSNILNDYFRISLTIFLFKIY